MLAKSIMYGILAVIYLAKEQGENYLPISLISEDIKVPFPYLNKIYLQLSERGIVLSKKGPKGGVRLIKPADELFLIDIVESIGNSNNYSSEDMKISGFTVEYNNILEIINSNTDRKVYKYFEKTSIQFFLNKIK